MTLTYTHTFPEYSLHTHNIMTFHQYKQGVLCVFCRHCDPSLKGRYINGVTQLSLSLPKGFKFKGQGMGSTVATMSFPSHPACLTKRGHSGQEDRMGLQGSACVVARKLAAGLHCKERCACVCVLDLVYQIVALSDSA